MEKPRSSNTILVKDFDYTIFFTVIILVLFGVVMVFSSSYYMDAMDGDGLGELRSQGLYAVIGFCGLIFASVFNYRHLKRFVWLFYLVANVGLVAVLIFGDAKNGAKRWIEVFGFSVQPSEVAKVAIAMVLAKIISEDRNMFKNIYGFIRCAIVLLIPAALVAIGGNLSTVLIMIAIAGAIIFVSSPYFWRYIFMALAGIGGLTAYLAFGGGFRSGRFAVWLDPASDPRGTGYQILQSLYAVASGGLFGLGLGQSRQKLGYIPEAHNDIIFAITCEELGFFGAAFLLIVFAILIWKGIRTAIGSTDLFGCLLATGIITQIAVQVIINVAVVTNSIPNTGIPMPFVSSGGTALIMNMGSMGILLSISRYSRA